MSRLAITVLSSLSLLGDLWLPNNLEHLFSVSCCRATGDMNPCQSLMGSVCTVGQPRQTKLEVRRLQCTSVLSVCLLSSTVGCSGDTIRVVARGYCVRV